MPELAELITAIHQREAPDRWGVGTAAEYLKSVAPHVASHYPAEQWQKAMAEAEERLTWCDEQSADADLIAKGFADTGVPDGFCAMFDCVLTSKRKDRDGDILEPLGLKLDEQMPLLWQHIPIQPIGRLLKVLDHTDLHVKVRFGLVDTDFGRDVAKLVKAGILRMSHGFKPYEFEPVGGPDEKSGEPSGWHIKSGEIREGSLVSIPSNVDGRVVDYRELKEPVVKAWAEELATKQDPPPATKDAASEPKEPEPAQAAAEPEPAAQASEPEPESTKGVFPAAAMRMLADHCEHLKLAGTELGEALQYIAGGEVTLAVKNALALAAMTEAGGGSFGWLRTQLQELLSDSPEADAWIDEVWLSGVIYRGGESWYTRSYALTPTGPAWAGEPEVVQPPVKASEPDYRPDSPESPPDETPRPSLEDLLRRAAATAWEKPQEVKTEAIRKWADAMLALADDLDNEAKHQELASYLGLE